MPRLADAIDLRPVDPVEGSRPAERCSKGLKTQRRFVTCSPSERVPKAADIRKSCGSHEPGKRSSGFGCPAPMSEPKSPVPHGGAIGMMWAEDTPVAKLSRLIAGHPHRRPANWTLIG